MFRDFLGDFDPPKEALIKSGFGREAEKMTPGVIAFTG